MIQCQITRAYAKEFLEMQYPCEVMDVAFPNYIEEAVLTTYQGKSMQSMHAAFVDINYSSNDIRIREVSRERVERSIETGKKLGVSNVVVHTCCHPVLVNQNVIDIWCETTADYLRMIAEKYQVKIFVENTLDINPDILKRLMEMSDCKWLGVCLDVGHANLSKTPVEGWMKELKPYIGYLHLNDNRGRYDEHLPIGAGMIDWISLYRQIMQLEHEPIITIEVTKPEDFEKSVAFWEKL
jgi:sugar phosphate isomerase/epimerase